MRILVCGGRDFKDYDLLRDTLSKYPMTLLISGGAPGADTMAEKYAYMLKIPSHIFHADWTSYGRAAGPIRNRRMLIDGKPNLVIAFPGGKGTLNMVKQASKANVKVEKIGW
jgi:hypothetical protein